MKKQLNSGDIFLIPISDKRTAICQILWFPNTTCTNFSEIFYFIVKKITNDANLDINNIDRDSIVTFHDFRGDFNVIFGGQKFLKTGKWPIISHISLDQSFNHLRYFNYAGDLFYDGKHIRKLSLDEMKDYPLMAISNLSAIQETLIELVKET